MDYVITALTIQDNWVLGKANEIAFQAKVYDKPSRFRYGIDNGRVSKLYARAREKNRLLLDYDRGWNKRPETDEEKDLLEALLLFCNDLPDNSVWQITLRRPKRFLVTDGEVLEYEDE